MIYIASVRHKAAQCPGNDPDLMSEAAEKLSKANLLKKNIEIVDAFIDQSCFLQQQKPNSEHVCTFVLETSSSPDLTDLFTPFQIEVTPSIKWQGLEE
jgi:CDP-diacylglycerol pyrophosphatase